MYFILLDVTKGENEKSKRMRRLLPTIVKVPAVQVKWRRQPLTMASNFEYDRTDNIEWRSGRLKDIFDLGRRIITATWKVSC